MHITMRLSNYLSSVKYPRTSRVTEYKDQLISNFVIEQCCEVLKCCVIGCARVQETKSVSFYIPPVSELRRSINMDARMFCYVIK